MELVVYFFLSLTRTYIQPSKTLASILSGLITVRDAWYVVEIWTFSLMMCPTSVLFYLSVVVRLLLGLIVMLTL